MLRLALDTVGEVPKVAFGLSAENLRRLRAGLAITSPMEELVKSWVGDVWLIAKDPKREEGLPASLMTPPALHEIAKDQQKRTGRPQIILALDESAFSKLEAVPRKVLTLTLKEPWRGYLFLFHGDTEAELMKECGPLIGPKTTVKIDRLAL